MSDVFSIDAVEVHAEGEPGRVVLSAGGLVQGATMAERIAYCREHLDGLRRLLLHEPRGYPALCGVFVVPAVEPGSDFGIVVLEQGGFTPMSGSNTICAVTAAIDAGLVAVPPGARTHEVVIDTAVGTVRAVAELEGGRTARVTVANVPAYVVGLDRSLDVPELGTVEVDIAYGGQFFAQTDVRNVGLELDPARGRDLVRAGALIRLAAAEQLDTPVNLVMLHSGDPVPGTPSRNTVVLTNGRLDRADPTTWTGALDRSPCGTGTCARMAVLHARGQLGVDEPFVHRSIVGSEFHGRLTGTTTVDGRPAVLPTISGRGWVTGRAQWVLDASDLFPTGYTVSDIWAPQ